MVWDAYKCHTSEQTRKELDRVKLNSAVIPGGCTKFIQAPDVVWNAILNLTFVNIMTSGCLNPVLMSTPKLVTCMRPPSRSLLCDWVKAAWDVIPSETITKSFLSCAITTSVEGQDDHESHCFKPGQPCETGRTALEQEMLQFNQESINVDDDPFASDIDEDESEANEVCIDESQGDDLEFDNDADSDE